MCWWQNDIIKKYDILNLLVYQRRQVRKSPVFQHLYIDQRLQNKIRFLYLLGFTYENVQQFRLKIRPDFFYFVVYGPSLPWILRKWKKKKTISPLFFFLPTLNWKNTSVKNMNNTFNFTRHTCRRFPAAGTIFWCYYCALTMLLLNYNSAGTLYFYYYMILIRYNYV